METTIDTLIPFAIKCIEQHPDEDFRSNGKIKGIYESYLSQFGPMSIQIGLRSTLAVYNNKKNKGGGNREFILNLIHKILKKSSMRLSNVPGEECADWINIYLKEDISQQDEQLILDASVALKRAIRTFSLTDDKSNNA